MCALFATQPRLDPSIPADPVALVPRYQKIRAISTTLNDSIVKTLPGEAITEGAARLGLLKNKTIVLPTEACSDILMDYCLYNVRTGGMNAVERFLAETPPPNGSIERRCLEAKRRSVYSLFVAQSIHRKAGLLMRDLLLNETHFTFDLGLAMTGDPGLLILSRLIELDGITFTGGAALPLGHLPEQDAADFLRDLLPVFPHNDRGIIEPATAIRLALENVTPANASFGDSLAFRIRDLKSPGFIPRPTTPRNAPCPCGSGRKFKNCCADRDK